MDKWEYIFIHQSSGPFRGIHYILPNGEEKKYSGDDSHGKDIHQLLNFFGNQGFEFPEATTSATNAGIYNRIWVLKRPKPEE